MELPVPKRLARRDSPSPDSSPAFSEISVIRSEETLVVKPVHPRLAACFFSGRVTMSGEKDTEEHEQDRV